MDVAQSCSRCCLASSLRCSNAWIVYSAFVVFVIVAPFPRWLLLCCSYVNRSSRFALDLFCFPSSDNVSSPSLGVTNHVDSLAFGKLGAAKRCSSCPLRSAEQLDLPRKTPHTLFMISVSRLAQYIRATANMHVQRPLSSLELN